MRVLAIGDLHLPGPQNKTMDEFGPKWRGHVKVLEKNWRESVRDDDIVLIPGDITWASSYDEARAELKWLDGLPGRIKVLSRGNHEYWWNRVERMEADHRTLRFANGFYSIPEIGINIVACVGYTLPRFIREERRSAELENYCRQLQHLWTSVRTNADVLAAVPRARNFAMLHYPPIESDGTPSGLHEPVRLYCANCVFGHLHGDQGRAAWTGRVNGTTYHFVAADWTGFRPALIAEDM
ncbi:MAG: metallophosphoesterase [Planctomycetota bacterium]|nr:metallophosphoesterase [Planctomycetota bacterium]